MSTSPTNTIGTWVIDEWSKIGLKVTQRVVPTGPWFEALRSGNFDVVVTGNCQSVVNPLLDVQTYLPGSVYAANYGNFEDPEEVDLYDKMLRETDPAKQRALMRDFERYVARHRGARYLLLLWWYRMVPASRICEGLEDQPEPLSQPGLWRRSGSTNKYRARRRETGEQLVAVGDAAASRRLRSSVGSGRGDAESAAAS